MATIILTGGGTAGHCTPHLAILPYIKNDFDKIYYIGSKNGIEKDIIKNEQIPYYSVPCAKLKRNFSFDNLKIPFTVISGIKQAGILLDKLKPDVVFSKGGFVSIPTVIAASKRKIPVISHESDYTIGLANKLTSKYCKKILTTFPETAKHIKHSEYVGAPIRKSLFSVDKSEALKTFGFKEEKPILLITGGSQGAVAINDALRKSLANLLARYNVIHICGKNNLLKEKTPTGYFQAEFLSNIEQAFAVADVCVSRSGSNTLFELMSLQIPCVLIPLPKGASRGDQILNAEYFQKLGLAYVLDQSVLTPESLCFAINATYANRFNIKRNFSNHPISDASRQISRIIADYIK